jgi:hypothetical protein
MSFTLNHFIFDRINMVLILREQQILGAHTDVILFEPKVITTFKWTHPGARPMGNDTPCSIQCPDCHRLKTPSPQVTTDRNVIRLKCSECPWKDDYSVPTGFKCFEAHRDQNYYPYPYLLVPLPVQIPKIGYDKIVVHQGR